LTLPILCQDYAWPTSASHALSSSFGEYRAGHFHAGIDVKTWNQEGYPCYAVADGRISRIRVSPFGYGKALYLKLDDGSAVVYAHLQKFNPELDAAVFQKQIAAKRYSLSWEPKDWRVKKGQIIAYTGQSGSGSPHLHFEWRNPQGRPINPLRFYRQIKDKTAPVLQSLLVIPQDEHSAVNGSFMPLEVELKTTGKNRYTAAVEISARGRIGLALMGYDLTDAAPNKMAWREVSLSANGQAVFSRICDEVDFALTNQVDIEIDYPRKISEGRVFHKLYIEPYNQLPFYDLILGNGQLSVPDDTLHLTIQVSDFFKNESRIDLHLLPEPPVPIVATMIRKLNDLLFLQLELPVALQQLQFRVSGDKTRWQACDYFEALDRSQELNKQRLLVKLPLQNPDARFIEVQLTTSAQIIMNTILPLDQPKELNPDVQFFNTGKYLAALIANLPAHYSPVLQIQQNDKIASFPLRANASRQEAVIPARSIVADSQRISLVNGAGALFDTTLHFLKLLPGQNQTHSFFDNFSELLIFPGSVYDTLLFTASAETVPPLNGNGVILSRLLHLSHNQQIFKGAAQLKMRYDPTGLPARQIGLYRLTDSGKWKLAGQAIDSLQLTAAAEITALGRFFVAADTIPPKVSIVSPAHNTATDTTILVKFTVQDELSGILSDEQISVGLDNRFTLAEWDPETDIVVARPHWPFRAGQHIIIIRVTDAAGNITRRELVVNSGKSEK
jgi:hypothetical protein